MASVNKISHMIEGSSVISLFTNLVTSF